MTAPIPSSTSGAIRIILMGAGGAILALVIAQFFPQIIPTRASGVAL